MIRNGARFCDTGCAQNYREDRSAGAIYGAVHHTEDDQMTGLYWTWDEWSLHAGTCAYCNSPVRGVRKIIAPRCQEERWDPTYKARFMATDAHTEAIADAIDSAVKNNQYNYVFWLEDELTPAGRWEIDWYPPCGVDHLGIGYHAISASGVVVYLSREGEEGTL